MKRSLCIIAMVLLCVGGFLGYRFLAGEETGGKPDGFDVTAISDVIHHTAGIPGDMVIFTVDGEPVTAQEYLYWVGYSADTLFYGTEGNIDWNMDIGEMGTLRDAVKEQSKQTAMLYRLMETNANRMGLSLTQQELDELDRAAMETMDSVGGEYEFQKLLLEMGITPEGFGKINESQYYYEKVRSSLEPEPATQQDMQAYVEENGLLRAKHILIDGGEDMEAALERAQELRDQLKDGGDDHALFDRLMAEESADPGSAAYPNGYLFGPGEMVETFEAGTKALEMGEISDPVESTYGYHIILRLDPMDDPEELNAMMEEGRKDAAMNEKLNLWMTEAVVEETQEYKDLNVETYITNLYALRDEIAAADAAAQEDTENTTEE